MSERPVLKAGLKSKEFLGYYYLKEELVQFCRDNGLTASGGKQELTERIAAFLDGRKVNMSSGKTSHGKKRTDPITVDSLIEENIVCSEVHRAFFKSEIGESFSFNVAFQKWLKTNTGKTYAEAVSAYHEIKNNTSGGRKNIGRQFEYNTYVRDFFEHNKGRSLDDAIRCWKYKKGLPGHNRYEDTDLEVLKNG